MIAESVTPEGLKVRAEIQRRVGDHSCARHLELAAAEIHKLLSEREDLLAQLRDMDSDRLSGADKLASPNYLIYSFQTDLHAENRQARLVFYNQPNQRHVLGYFVMDAPELYDFAQGLLRDYDTLEGVE